jgi:subtilisin family serine protease
VFIHKILKTKKIDAPNTIWLRPNEISNLSIPKINSSGELEFTTKEVNDFFKRHNIKDFSLAFPAIKDAPEKYRANLDKIYKIVFENDVTNIADSIKKTLSKYYSDIEIMPIYEPLHTPNDLYLLDNVHGQNWQLSLINAEGAWDITTGSPNIPIAIIEVSNAGNPSRINNYDLNHNDLQANIIYFNDNVQTQHNHGTFVAGCASAVTNNNFGISSIGYNSSLMLYRGTNPNNWIDAANRGARVISCSYISCSFSDATNNIINTLTNMGVIFVAGAGNGIYPMSHPETPGANRASCGLNGNGYGYPASYQNVISVTSIGQDNRHWDDTDGSGSRHTHNDSVDICAPGYRVLSTLPNNNWGRSSGTSFSTPITAGLIALMLSINPCLNTDEIKSIFNSTSATINDQNNYAGLLGAGRINAFEAVKRAGTRNISFASFNGFQTESAGYALNIAYANIANNSHILLTARKEVKIATNFSMPLGSSLEITIDPDAVNSCN